MSASRGVSLLLEQKSFFTDLETRMQPAEAGSFGKGVMKCFRACKPVPGGVEVFDHEGLGGWTGSLGLCLVLRGAKGRVFLVAEQGEEVLLSGARTISRLQI